jgi:glycylpeptide N-tetradecanoyltransferase
MNDALVLAKNEGFDVFNALDIMDNETFIKDLMFSPGDGCLNYYLYNWKLGNGMLQPNSIGIVLV